MEQNNREQQKEPKMGWLIDDIISNKIFEYSIEDTNRHHGAISCPTAWGKSALFFRNMLYHMQQAKEKHGKLILNLCTPIIKLCAQQGVDFIELLSEKSEEYGVNLCEYYNFDKSKIRIFNNNSGDPKIYQNDEEISTMVKYDYLCLKINDLYDYFINDDNCEIAIIISCNKSMAKFINKFKSFTPLNTTIITYLDEAHTITIDDTEIDEETTKIDLESLCKICNYLYLISATNKKNLVEIVNSYDGVYDDSYIINVTPGEAIEKNIICAPNIGYAYTNDGEIDPNTCISFMRQVINENTLIHHKILITCNGIAKLKSLRELLSNKGFTVFSTTSEEGMYKTNGKSNYEYNGVKPFINDIKEYEDHCFILHCKQLISGIDIPCITDAIISKDNIDKDDTCITIIQTIGRCLRLKKEERGKPVEKRNKKYANILFVIKEDNIKVPEDLSKFVLSYYGIGNSKFNSMNFGNKHITNKKYIDLYTKDTPIQITPNYVYNELILKIEAFIQNYCLRHVKFCEEINVAAEAMLKDDLILLAKQCQEFINGGIYVTKYISNITIKKEIDTMLKKYDLNNLCKYLDSIFK